MSAVQTHHARRRAGLPIGKVVLYLLLIGWGLVCLFPLYWTVTLSVKNLRMITTGPKWIPWIDFDPVDLGWRDVTEGSQGERFLTAAQNSLVISLAAGGLALVLGSLAGYGLTRFDYKLGPWRNRDISIWFLSQLVLPPAAIILPVYILYNEIGLYDTRLGMILLYTVAFLPIVVWVMRDQFNTIPVELEQAAMVDGSSIWGAFLRIAVPIAAPGMVASFVLVVIFCWNEYLFAAILTSKSSFTLPQLIATQVSSQGVKFWTMAAITIAAVTPLIVVGILLERYIVKGLTAGAVK